MRSKDAAKRVEAYLARMGMPKKLFQEAKQPPELAEIQGITDKEKRLSLSVNCRARFRTDCLPPHPKQASGNIGRCPRFSRRLCRAPGPLFPMPTIKQGSNR
jgi:hypothetical protein